MKRFYLGVVALALLLILAACSSDTFAPQQGLAPQHGGERVGALHGADDGHDDHIHALNLDAALERLDAENADIVSPGPGAKVIKNVALTGRGVRLEDSVTTDVWALDGYAYTGTFSTLCSDGPGGNESGVWIWDVSNKNKVSKVGVIETTIGSKTNDVKVATMNSGDILVMSNESCNGGLGGFDIYNVDDPENPIFLAQAQTDDANAALRETFGVVGSGVHNLYLFTQGDRDYVGASAENDFGNFQVFDITDPANPVLVFTWGPEEAEFDDELAALGLNSFAEGDNEFWLSDGFDLLVEADGWIFEGFGASANRVMHDLYVTDDGTKAYVNFWDAGLVLLDISDIDNPVYISTALDPTSEDGEVNSHSVWPNEDGTIVVEGEEDFAPYESVFSVEGLGEFPAAPGNINPSGLLSGPTVYVGLACDAASVPPAMTSGQVALIQRGVCAFTTKGNNAAAAGYDAMVVFNDAARGDALVAMGGDPVSIPGVFVGHSTGLAIMNVASADELEVGAEGRAVDSSEVWNGWSGLRIWDYSDPENPILASTFNTVCSAIENGAGCIEGGTYSSHNVQVETKGNKVLAYVSWYFDGMLVLDVTDPYNPVEVARYLSQNEDGSPNDFWGVYKEANSPYFYGSDRSGGLYVFKLTGQGTIGKK